MVLPAMWTSSAGWPRSVGLEVDPGGGLARRHVAHALDLVGGGQDAGVEEAASRPVALDPQADHGRGGDRVAARSAESRVEDRDVGREAVPVASAADRDVVLRDTRTLPGAGTYTILVDPQAASTGSMTVTLYDVPPDAGGPIGFGSPATANVSTPGQNVAFSFAGQANQRVSVKLSGVTISTSQVSTYIALPSVVPSGLRIGTYAVVVDPQAAATGSITVTLYDVPPDATGNLVGGPSLIATMSVPGQNGRFTFDGHVGQRVSLALSAVTVSTSYVSILRPDGTTLVGLTLVTTTGRTFTVDPPVDGTYAVVVDPLSTATGSMTLALAAG
ncbi:MAG TPA: hypothetical protein VIU81_13480 [Gaiellaceae bacterium]